jgi:hypothetical protein
LISSLKLCTSELWADAEETHAKAISIPNAAAAEHRHTAAAAACAPLRHDDMARNCAIIGLDSLAIRAIGNGYLTRLT